MNKYQITGGEKLIGEVEIEGSKNSVLPILAACILNEKESVIKNCPNQKDVNVMICLLKKMGCKIKMEKNIAVVDSSNVNTSVIVDELAAELRASIILLGPILSKFKKVTITHPGECVIVMIFKS